MSNYPTNLTEKQWQVINKIVEPQERSRKTSLREIINAIFYLIKSGCQWRMLPTDFAPWHVIENNDKKYGRIRTLNIINDTIEMWIEKHS